MRPGAVPAIDAGLKSRIAKQATAHAREIWKCIAGSCSRPSGLRAVHGLGSLAMIRFAAPRVVPNNAGPARPPPLCLWRDAVRDGRGVGGATRAEECGLDR